MNKKYKVGIIGATGFIGQRFVTILETHPWFEINALAASFRSTGKTYKEAVENRWVMRSPIPSSLENMKLLDIYSDKDKIVSLVDFVFCAVEMKKEEIKFLEETYAKSECPVISNNSAHRDTPDVPMIIPEINPDHSKIISAQRKRLRTKKGFIAVKSNCSLQSYVPAIHPLMDLGVTKVLACTYQAISGASHTFESWPEITNNLIPFINGEEEKSELEPLKIWGKLTSDKILNATSPSITSQCFRVPVTNGHTAAVFLSFNQKISLDEIIQRWETFRGRPQALSLPSAPKKFLYYFKNPDKPQIRSEKNLENGMAISIGRLREDTHYDIKFVCMSHNTIRGAAGGAILLAELLCVDGYI